MQKLRLSKSSSLKVLLIGNGVKAPLVPRGAPYMCPPTRPEPMTKTDQVPRKTTTMKTTTMKTTTTKTTMIKTTTKKTMTTRRQQQGHEMSYIGGFNGILS